MSELIKKPAAEWYKQCDNVEIMDYDGFDRSNFDFTWNQLLMTKEEFNDRLARCTCKFPGAYIKNRNN